MTFRHSLACALAVGSLLAGAASADEGHDHGDAAPAAAGQGLPRFTAVSEAFELVGVLSGRQITLYLDRFADGRPVHDARIELEIGGASFVADRQGDDTYEVVLPALPKPGMLPITATVSVGQEADLLAGELDLHDAAHTEEAGHTLGWMTSAGAAAAGIGAFGLLGWAGRRVFMARGARTAGAA